MDEKTTIKLKTVYNQQESAYSYKAMFRPYFIGVSLKI